MTRLVATSGPRNARVMLVGEAPGHEEERTLQPFSGQSGQELKKMLQEAGIPPSACYFTYVCRTKPPTNDIEADYMWSKKSAPPIGFVSMYGKYVHANIVHGVDELWADIAEINPDVIIPLGNVALWAVSEGAADSAANWRGSQLVTSTGHRFVPTLSPATILRQWSWRIIMVTDLRRACGWVESGTVEPVYHFIVRPAFDTAMQAIRDLQKMVEAGPTKLAVDIETRQNEIACIGIAWSKTDAVCIPILCVERLEGYWTLDEETALVTEIMRLLSHPNAHCVGQNFIYDVQFFHRQYNVVPNTRDDTMVMQHVAFAGMQKGLDFLSSLYCAFHRFWKEEGKLWDPVTTNEDQLWVYNCKDAVITYEVSETLESLLAQLNLTEQYHFQIRKFWWSILLMTLRGIAVDTQARGSLARDLLESNQQLTQLLQQYTGRTINIKSPKQLQEYFYGELGLPPVRDRKTQRISTNFESLQKLAEKEPLIWPIVNVLLTMRSIGVFVSTFLESEVDIDGRMRCSFNVAGPETYRLASSKNPFGSGMNMQNIPSGDRKKLIVAMPNVRKTFKPDMGHTIFDIDLDRADLQVVVWEANDADLKRQLRIGVDLHIMNGILLAGKEPPPEDELIEGHPNYPEHKKRYKDERQLAKNFVHGTNYGGKEKTMAAVCRISVAQCADLQKRWFALHPGIKKWHERVERMLQTQRFVTNAFGYRRYYYDRIDSILPEALAWIPQSTVAAVTSRMQTNIEEFVHDVHLLIQVHDSLVGQYLTRNERLILPHLHKACLITVPYPDPLIIPVGLKTSTKSWGDCEEKKWPIITI